MTQALSATKARNHETICRFVSSCFRGDCPSNPCKVLPRSKPMTSTRLKFLMVFIAARIRERRVRRATSGAAQAPDYNAFYRSARTRCPRWRAEGRGARAVRAAQPGVSGHAAHLLGVRAGAVRRGGAGEPDDLPGWTGVQGHGRCRPRAERARQPDLSPRNPGDDCRLHQSGPHARAAGTDAGELGRPRRRTARPNTTRWTTSTRASSSTS